MKKWLYIEIWKHGQWIHLCKAHDTVEALSAMLKKELPNRRFNIYDENDWQAVFKIF